MVTGAVKHRLIKHDLATDFDALPEKYHKIPHFTLSDGSRCTGVEWDGVFSCKYQGAQTLFLVEAKKTKATTGVMNIPDRIERTRKFIEQETEPVGSKRDTACVVLWRQYKSMNIKAVIGADVLADSAKVLAAAHSFFTVQQNLDAFEVTGYSDQSSLATVVSENDLEDV